MIDYAEWVDEYEGELKRLNAIKDKLEAEYSNAFLSEEGYLDLKFRIAHYKQLILECQTTINTLKGKTKKF